MAIAWSGGRIAPRDAQRSFAVLFSIKTGCRNLEVVVDQSMSVCCGSRASSQRSSAEGLSAHYPVQPLVVHAAAAGRRAHMTAGLASIKFRSSRLRSGLASSPHDSSANKVTQPRQRGAG
jgi:hypothetical protein